MSQQLLMKAYRTLPPLAPWFEHDPFSRWTVCCVADNLFYRPGDLVDERLHLRTNSHKKYSWVRRAWQILKLNPGGTIPLKGIIQ